MCERSAQEFRRAGAARGKYYFTNFGLGMGRPRPPRPPGAKWITGRGAPGLGPGLSARAFMALSSEEGTAKRRQSRPQSPSNLHRKPAANRSRITARIGGVIPATKPHGSQRQTAAQTGRDRRPISNGIGRPKPTRIGGASALGVGKESAGQKRQVPRHRSARPQR